MVIYQIISEAHAQQPLNLHATATEARVPRACAPQQKKPLQWEAPVLQLEKICTATKIQNSQKKRGPSPDPSHLRREPWSVCPAFRLCL